MRIAIDEDIPNELTPLFRGPGLVVEHVEDLGFKGQTNGELLAALSRTHDVLVTGDTNLPHQQNLDNFDIAVVLIHPRRLLIDQASHPTSRRCVCHRDEARRHDDRGRDDATIIDAEFGTGFETLVSSVWWSGAHNSLVPAADRGLAGRRDPQRARLPGPAGLVGRQRPGE